MSAVENIRSTYSYKKPDSRQAVSDILITKQVRVISYPRSGKFPRLLFPLPPLSPLAASPLLPLLHVPSRPCLSSPNSQGQFTLSTFPPPSRLCHPSSFSHLHLSHVLFPPSMLFLAPPTHASLFFFPFCPSTHVSPGFISYPVGGLLGLAGRFDTVGFTPFLQTLATS